MRRVVSYAGATPLMAVRNVRVKGKKEDDSTTPQVALTGDEVLEEVMTTFNLGTTTPEFKRGVNGAYKAVGVLMNELHQQLHPPPTALDLTVRKEAVLQQQRKFFPSTKKTPVAPPKDEEGDESVTTASSSSSSDASTSKDGDAASSSSTTTTATTTATTSASTTVDNHISLISYLTRSLFPANALPKETPNWEAIGPAVHQPGGSFVSDRYFPVTNTFLLGLFSMGLPAPAPGVDTEPYVKDRHTELGTLLEGLIHTYSYSHQIQLKRGSRIMSVGANIAEKVKKNHPIFTASPLTIAHPNDHINRIQVLQVYVNGDPVMLDVPPVEAAPEGVDRTAAKKAIKARIKECEASWGLPGKSTVVWPEGQEPPFIIGVELLVGVVSPPQRFNSDVEFYTGKIELPEYAIKDGPMSTFSRASQSAIASFMANSTSTRVLRFANTIHQLFTGRDMRVPFGAIISKMRQLGDVRPMQGSSLFLAHKFKLMENEEFGDGAVAKAAAAAASPTPAVLGATPTPTPSEDQKCYESIIGKPGQFPVQVKRMGLVYLPTQKEWLVDLIETEV